MDDFDIIGVQSDFTKSNAAFREFCLNLQKNYAGVGTRINGTSRQVNETMKTVSDLARSLNLVVQPDSDFTFQISDTMREVSLMSKSLKRLADLLERNRKHF